MATHLKTFESDKSHPRMASGTKLLLRDCGALQFLFSHPPRYVGDRRYFRNVKMYRFHLGMYRFPVGGFYSCTDLYNRKSTCSSPQVPPKPESRPLVKEWRLLPTDRLVKEGKAWGEEALDSHYPATYDA